MSLMIKATFEGFADRIAKQYSIIKDCFDVLGAAPGSNSYYARITTTETPDIELAMLQVAYTADQWFATSSTGNIVKGYSSFTALMTAFEAALYKDGTLASMTWDGYMASVSTKVSDYTNQMYYAAKNSYLLAKNVWCEEQKVMASALMSDATTLAFTDGAPLYVGAFDAAQTADGTHFAGVPVKALVTGANTIGSLVITVTGTLADDTTGHTENITVSGAPGSLSTATTASFIDITGIARVSGGDADDAFSIINTKTRTISL